MKRLFFNLLLITLISSCATRVNQQPVSSEKITDDYYFDTVFFQKVVSTNVELKQKMIKLAHDSIAPNQKIDLLVLLVS